MLTRIRQIIARLASVPKAMYEAGKRYGNGARSWLDAVYGDARFDASQATRSEIARKARFFEANDAIVNRLADLFEQYTVGPTGIPVIPSTSDEAFNATAAREWAAWCERCDFNGQVSFSTMQSLAARAWFIDGDGFWVKTSNMGFPAEPRLQMVESHRVSGPDQGFNSSRVHDGVALDSYGRPVGFWINTATPGEMTTAHRLFAASDVVHIWEPSRIGMLRGLSFLYPVLNDLHDLSDLGIYEMRAAKASAEPTTVITNEAGELTTGQLEDLQRSRFSGTVQNAEGTDITVEKSKYYANSPGGRTLIAQRGDKVEQFVSQRPSVAVQAFWDHIIGKICVGVGMSKLLVFPASMQGTVVRADLDVCDAWFRSRSSVMQGKVVEVYQWWIKWAVLNVPGMTNPPKDFLRCTTRAPRSVKVDVGYDSAATIAELKAGLRTYESICAPMGEDWRNVLQQSAVEAAFVSALADKFGIPAHEIASKAYESAANRAAMTDQQPRTLAA